jgi:hypothetical protein
VIVADAAWGALVICKRGKKITLRETACKAKETAVSATELGVVGPTGATGAAGPTGATGATGATGTPGSAIAYARVAADGTVDLANSKNITQSNVALDSTSAYCFSGLPFTFKSAVATPDYGSNDAETSISTVALGDPYGDCFNVPGTQLEVATSIGGAFAPVGFFIVFN